MTGQEATDGSHVTAQHSNSRRRPVRRIKFTRTQQQGAADGGLTTAAATAADGRCFRIKFHNRTRRPLTAGASGSSSTTGRDLTAADGRRIRIKFDNRMRPDGVRIKFHNRTRRPLTASASGFSSTTGRGLTAADGRRIRIKFDNRMRPDGVRIQLNNRTRPNSR